MTKCRRMPVAVLVAIVVAATVLPADAAEREPADSGSGLVAAVGGFSDVGEGSVHAPAVDALASEGVFEDTECGPGLFCPGEPILRWEMAVWLVRVLDGGAEPEAVVSSRFADVDPGVWWAPYVERLAELEVTRGCDTGPLRYCPEEAVNRAQMASFLVRAFDLGVGPPAGFGDVGPGGTHAADIDALAAAGVTQGCTDTMFCPRRDTTRAQMATFLHRARNVDDHPGRIPTFDPFATPTVSDIDLDRLAEAVETLDPEADCPATAAPASLDDVAEVVRIAGGCFNVEYVPLEGRSIEEVREELASDPEVHAVDLPETDHRLLSFHDQEGRIAQWHLEAIEADELWRWRWGADVVVAVIDTGVDGDHQDLDDNLIATDDDCHRTVTHSHGTHVAGIIAAERNEQDVVGVAPEARVLPIKLHLNPDQLDPTCHELVPTTAAAVLLAVQEGAEVINMSFGGPDGRATAEAAIRAAMMRDIVLVAAAGNCGDDTESTREEEKAPDWQHQGCATYNAIGYPAAFSGVISVSSIDDGGTRAHDSTVNRHVGIAAPGEEILSTVRNGGTAVFNGTSMAAPVISGVVARMKSRFPKASVGEIRQALYTTARQPKSDETGIWTEEYGWGVVQPADAMWDLFERFYPCDALLESGEPLVAYDIDVDIDADGDTIDDDRVGLFDRRDVWVADEAGTDWCRLAHNSAHPAWSPDGEHLAFAHRVHDPRQDPQTGAWVVERQVDIWVLPIRGGPWRRVTDTEVEEYDLDWSTGGQIAYTAAAGGGFEIWVVDASGTQAPRNLTGQISGSQFQPSWSPNGTRIAYVSNSDGDNDIWVMNADGTNPRNLTNYSAGNEEHPAWSPDGTRIVYESDRSGGDPDIWVMNADGSGHRNLHDSDDPEWKPAWSHDGSRILFVRSTGDGDDNIWSMDAQTGENWQLITTATAEDIRFNAAAESNPAVWAPATPREVRISWGSDASSRSDCPEDTTCWNLEYEYVGSWEPPPYTLECWGNGQQGWVGQWTGRPTTGCYYSAGTAHVVIDGVRSNSLVVPEQPAPDDRGVRISWGSDAGGRADCPPGTKCWNLEYEYVGNWESPPYTLECWANGQQGWVGQWTGRPTTGCYYWGGTAHVVIDGIRSNTITAPTTPVSEGAPSCGPAGRGGKPCAYLVYEDAFDDNGDGYKDRFEIWLVSADGTGKRKLADGTDAVWSPDGSFVAFLARGFGRPDLAVVATDGGTSPRILHSGVWPWLVDEEWLWSPDSTHVAYESMQHQGLPESDLWVAAVDGSSPPRKLVDYVFSYADRPWSSDSTHIAYTVYEDHDNDGLTETAELWVAAADGGSSPRMVSGDRSFESAWAPDGSRIAFHAWSVSVSGTVLHQESLGLRVAEADGSHEHTIADGGGTPMWSPDGQRIAYERSGQLWIAPADGSGTPLKLVDGGASGFGWSPDGHRIAYHLSVDTDGDGRRDSLELRVTTADGNGQHIRFAAKASMLNLFVTGAPRQSEPWSMAGTHLVYAVPAPNTVHHLGKHHDELWVARSDGTGQACRLTTSGTLRGWSPSGQHVAYHVAIDDNGDNVADRNSWWVARADCTGARKLTDGGWVDGWSPNGTHIAYSVPVDSDSDGEADRTAVWIVDIAGGGPPLLVTDNAPVNPSQNSDNSNWSPTAPTT